ncbi:MAG: EthD family reductase [Aromatoleum sp.]|nr:EthD family reductase [Aromatoleum sp.]
MAKVIAMYRMPSDPAAFDGYYYGTHVPLAKKVPGLQRYEVTRGPILTLEGPAPYYLIATLTFASVAEIHSALASPEGKATAADLGNFATAGVEIFIADAEDI